MNKTAVVKCDCEHRFQDETYGKSRRVTTPNNNKQEEKQFVVRCTVCSREHNLGALK